MATYAITLDCPNSTEPDVLWPIYISEQQASGKWILKSNVLCSRPDPKQLWDRLWVPGLDTWSLDTLRLVLHELAAFLPPHEPHDADATITATMTTPKPRGRRRADAPPLHPCLDPKSVTIAVQARGWRAEVWTWVDNNPPAANVGVWSVPMAAVLVDLAAKSPIPLAQIALVESNTLNTPSRRGTIRGLVADSQDDETLDRLVDRLEQLASTQPTTLRFIERLVERLADD